MVNIDNTLCVMMKMTHITHDIDQVAQALLAEEVVAIPTETVYGLAALAASPSAIKKVFELKKRPLQHPLILHVPRTFDLQSWVTPVSKQTKLLIQAFWPGSLTIVFPQKSEQVLDLITGGGATLAVRCPAHPLTQQLLDLIKQPLVAPSANLFRQVSPTTTAHVQKNFSDLPLLILEGGPCALGIESTIIAVDTADRYQLCRTGALPIHAIEAYVKLDKRKLSQLTPMPYQLKIPLFCFESEAALLKAYTSEKKIAVMAFHEHTLWHHHYFFKLPSDPATLAFSLYDQLHFIDTLNVEAIYVVLPPNTSAWQAIRERLFRASHVNTI